MLTSRNPITGDETHWKVQSKPVKLRVGDEPKFRFFASMISSDGSRQPVPLIAKQVFAVSADDSAPAFTFADKWIWVQRAGIPTFDTIGILSPNEVLLPDITPNGGRFYGKHDVQHIPYDADRPDMLDRMFCLIPEAEIERLARDVVGRMTADNLSAPHDGPCDLVVYPNNAWHIGTYDLTMVRFRTDFSSEMENNRAVERFLDQLASLRWMLSRSDA